MRQLKLAVGYRAGLRDRLSDAARRHPTPLYLGPIWLLAALLLLAGLAAGRAWGADAAQQVLILVLGIVPALTVAVSVVDWLVTLLASPRVLPKLDLDEGIPDPFRTLVVVPALLGSATDVTALLQQLEVYYLGNLDPNLSFALLADPPDAAAQETPEDSAAARAGARRHPHAQRPLRGGRRAAVLSPVSRPAVEHERRRLDGVGAQAR